MSFMLACPNCGKRQVGEFTFRGELKRRPAPGSPLAAWIDYVFLKENRKGKHVEWWYHKNGCRRWFLVERDTMNNTDHRSFWFRDRPK